MSYNTSVVGKSQFLPVTPRPFVHHSTMLTNNTISSEAAFVEEAEPLFSLVLRITLACLICILNVIGNIMVCVVVKRNRKLRSFKNYYYGLFLVNLSIADVAVALLSIPFVLFYYEGGKYPFGFFGSQAACKLVPTISLMCTGASILSLTAVTLQRYMGIVYPMKARLTLGKVKIILVLVWLLAFIEALPYTIVLDVIREPRDNEYSCHEYWPPDSDLNGKGYTLFLFLVQYLIPVILTGIAYTQMGVILSRQNKEMEGKKVADTLAKSRHRKFIRLLVVLIASFALCYLPNHVLFFWYDYGSGTEYPKFTILMKYSHVFMWFNSCLNPYLYGALDVSFKKGYKKIILQCARLEGRAKVTQRRITKRLTRIASSRSFRMTTGATPSTSNDSNDDSDNYE